MAASASERRDEERCRAQGDRRLHVSISATGLLRRRDLQCVVLHQRGGSIPKRCLQSSRARIEGRGQLTRLCLVSTRSLPDSPAGISGPPGPNVRNRGGDPQGNQGLLRWRAPPSESARGGAGASRRCCQERALKGVVGRPDLCGPGADDVTEVAPPRPPEVGVHTTVSPLNTPLTAIRGFIARCARTEAPHLHARSSTDPDGVRRPRDYAYCELCTSSGRR